ncbi:MAG: hypothetical protein A2Y10_03835 [Planctomycetes bacterium GWF2_41_51]|nr:MAG: hypothetical protein A2Y10_03835 [Planctomycetes bacterium GWF2_41_51]HBG26029.1 hypothetical protein [Phycisphaerales bacterium]
MKYYLILISSLFIPQMLWAMADTKTEEQYIILMMPRSKNINEANFMQVMNNFQGPPQARVKVGLAFIFSYLRNDVNELSDSLKSILLNSEKTNTPVWIKFDGEQWWQNRPDLWNWWDPNKPGYDPNNRTNVEWRWWGPEYALKICWRNWGKQLRVLPPTNLMSPKYRKACHQSMDVLMPIILNWYKTLPEDKKYLFAGLNLGWESAIGINSFYYPNGDQFMDKPKSEDPQSGAIKEDVLSRGVVQQGFAAVKTAGIRDSGDITEEDLYKVVKIHLDDLSKYAYDFGFPREKIFTHGWGNQNAELMYDAAVNKYSCPGWSDYWYSKNPAENAGIMRNVEKSDAPYWAMAEWNLLPHEKKIWKDAISTILNLPGCKVMCVYGWKGKADKKQVIEAIHELVVESATPFKEEINNKSKVLE